MKKKGVSNKTNKTGAEFFFLCFKKKKKSYFNKKSVQDLINLHVLNFAF